MSSIEKIGFPFKIFAFDFDGTIVTDSFPEIGTAIPVIQNCIKECRQNGDKVILWTCRTGKFLDAAVEYCDSVGLVFDAVNDNIPEVKYKYGNARKVFADFYIDDKNSIIVNDLGTAITPIRMIPEPVPMNEESNNE